MEMKTIKKLSTKKQRSKIVEKKKIVKTAKPKLTFRKLMVQFVKEHKEGLVILAKS